MKNPDGQISNFDAALDAYVAGTESLRRLRPTSAAKTVACSAAATAALALAPSADAAIQYGVTNLFVPSPSGDTYQIFLDSDANAELRLQMTSADRNEFHLIATAALVQSDPFKAARLAVGNTIGPALATDAWGTAGILRDWIAGVPAGNWPGDSMNEANAGFLGIRFNHSNNTHYGWIRIGISNHISGGGPVAFTVYDWAWETTPNTAITITAIPEPGPAAGLALLAAGAAGVSAWRRRKQTPAQSA